MGFIFVELADIFNQMSEWWRGFDLFFELIYLVFLRGLFPKEAHPNYTSKSEIFHLLVQSGK